MPGSGPEKEPPPHPCSRKLVYLFDDIFDPADITAAVRFYKIILPLKRMGRTILITSTDYRTLRAPTDFFHIFSKGAFQAKLHSRQYNLLDDVFRHLQGRC
jgi:ABC-type sugar transport system ATPase subunit